MRQSKHHLAMTFVAGLSSMVLSCSGAGQSPDVPAEDVGCSEEMLVVPSAARLILTDAIVARLQARAAAGDETWTALQKRCEDYTTGTMYAPDADAYPSYPNVGQGYQGEEYPPVVRTLGLCYRTTTDIAARARYGEAGARLLDAMSTPVASGGQNPSTDSGYGIRNYVVGMAIGYDWLYPALSATTKTRVIEAINTWVDWYDESGFTNNDPIGNYFAGYFLAKTTAALATDGDNAKASTYWNDVVTRMWGELVKPQFTSMMAGGGWPEGWGYGRKAVLSMVEALWAAKTATGLDWWQELPLARDEAAYAMHFAWPSLKHIDDQGTIRAGVNLRPSAELFMGLASMMEAAGDSAAATARGFGADVLATAGDDTTAWSKFLYGDAAAPKASYTTNLSYFASGPGHVAMRSSWEKEAAWGAFSGGAYINAAYSGEQLFNAGGLSVVVGDQPLLINPTGWLPLNAGTAGEDAVYEDSYGTKERLLYNTFFVSGVAQNSLSPKGSRAHVERYEDGGGFVHARGVSLGDQYGSGGAKPVSQFTRDLVYVRPGSFVLFDRTTVAEASADQWLSFHTPVAPRQATPADPTQRRYDVVVGAAQIGSVQTLLPKSATTTTVALPASASRIEVHAPIAAATQKWLTTVTAGAEVGEQVRLSAADGNVITGDMVGVELMAPQNQVVLFAADHAATGSVTSVEYLVSQSAAEHVLVDVDPAAGGYTVTAAESDGNWRIAVTAGGPLEASASKTLSFKVSETGSISASAPPSETTPPPGTTTPPESSTPPGTAPATGTTTPRVTATTCPRGS
jgi:hypothetical protein